MKQYKAFPSKLVVVSFPATKSSLQNGTISFPEMFLSASL